MAAWFWLHQYQTIFLIRRKSLCINRQESIYGFFSLNTFKNFKSFRAKQIIFQNLRQISDGLAFCYLTTHNLLVYTVELSGKTKFGNRSWNSPATMIKRKKNHSKDCIPACGSSIIIELKGFIRSLNYNEQIYCLMPIKLRHKIDFFQGEGLGIITQKKD